MQRKLSGLSAGKHADGGLEEEWSRDFQAFACEVCTRTDLFTSSLPGAALKAHAVSYDDGRGLQGFLPIQNTALV